MKNEYAKKYYDTFLKNLPGDYKSARWFSSPASKLDYVQTRRSLKHALGSKLFDNVLEIGPGDGVWTDLIIPKAKKLTLLDQSIEMLERAKERLKDVPNITFLNQDFLQFSPTETVDLVFAIRCFEYFEDKDKAVQKFADLLTQNGTLIIVTKNPEHAKMGKVQEQELHTGQISKEAMVSLLKNHGFEVEKVLSATWRLKAKFALLRVIFNLFHHIHVCTNGFFMVPCATNKLTESYLYVAHKK